MKIKDIINYLEKWAPLPLQESYDNSGLLVGDSQQTFKSANITLDVTEKVIDETLEMGANLLIAHHPLIFRGLKKIGNHHWLDRCIVKAIKNDLCIYGIHTNLDNVKSGVNAKIAEKIGLVDTSILQPMKGRLQKIVTFIPKENTESVLQKLYEAGAGNIGNYDQCSFRVSGKGSFRPNDEANPAIGEANRQEFVEEDRVEIIYPDYLSGQILQALKNAHPYEEVAYYQQTLQNTNQDIGAGMIGYLPEEMRTKDFFDHLKSSMNLKTFRHTEIVNENVRKITLCSGSGSFLLERAKSKKADVFISGDFKHHDFFEANRELIIADIGHFESEVFTKELIYDELKEKFANIALHLSEVNTNPIQYY
jgi:dinuclear metal center YbgI/SA1388 family protein